MLEITVPAGEYFDETTNEFIETKQTVLQLEHSLISLSKWESKWKKPFIGKTPKTIEESIDYVRCMTIGRVDPSVYHGITSDMMDQINRYIDDSMTATTFSDRNPQKGAQKKITAEIIYYQMTALGIPFECEKWHLNRLLTLIHVCSLKQQPAKKMSKRESAQRNTALNEARRQKARSRG